MIEIENFLEYVVKGIVENPDDVTVTKTVDDLGTLLSLQVNTNDLGQVIGKSGSTANSLRTIMRVAGTRNDQRVNIKIIEPE